MARLAGLLALFAAVTAVTAAPSALHRRQDTSTTSTAPVDAKPQCRCYPGEPCWPKQKQWDAFNSTIGGKLVATVPIGSPCHDSSFGPLDPTACTALKSKWNDPATHFTSSSSIMSPFFANASCDPFLSANTQCVTGTYVQYAVAATSTDDFQKTIAFAKDRNLRLVVRNTGHDFFGKSTGAGALAIWTQGIKDVTPMNYQSGAYTGPAMKIGAGVLGQEVYEVASQNNVVVVGGACPSVGIAGGYTQGGGHSLLTTKYGMAADHVLEWEVVTPNGDLVVASPSQNQDLYWALSGGGGGTYGIVRSMTVKTFPELKTAAATLAYSSTGINPDLYFDLFKIFLTCMPAIVEAGGSTVWILTPLGFKVAPVMIPGSTKDAIDTILQPFLQKLRDNAIPFLYSNVDYASYHDAFQATTPFKSLTETHTGGRLIPKSLVSTDDGLNQFVSAMRAIVSKGPFISGLNLDASKKTDFADNSVNPAWRDAAMHIILLTPYNHNDWNAAQANQRAMTEQIVPIIKNITPGGSCYLNEGDFNEPDWQRTFYGSSYQKLLSIKQKYDSSNMLWGRTAVGSEAWYETDDKHLCKA
ncbi:6-hydroxy-D-nicotine oxidase [Nannizzia gypsea CBS 118893]|uniref:6-hydroxy-D-nicotine oxidase n=1 Tax=Arthroderma gypseum (strain ATCC MYA-4604 / CBS 118893) TaxID=535722 RepID=E4UMW1_ARTGP|nr:6-hydroxy-D-nicotine oxidase [Nannizzia gypsea CBS 118893]EFQ99475.1 6-hydroxy-D-nicotine oxidase [Nannizzia gypsea CBS 118893]